MNNIHCCANFTKNENKNYTPPLYKISPIRRLPKNECPLFAVLLEINVHYSQIPSKMKSTTRQFPQKWKLAIRSFPKIEYPLRNFFHNTEYQLWTRSIKTWNIIQRP